ncbi:serine/threonine protein kinase [Candidatus Uabimicrobium sp. HlEnr_7]|uniref:serine/threonine protein kinase n=1 Tax=Candidatus Uabimicrobium helgolandensis TaxID=3095367 RepID=UPI003557614F
MAWFVQSQKDKSVFGPYTEEILQYYILQGKINQNYQISQDKKIWISVENWKQNQQKSIGKYRIINELGRGGMGVVYLAYDPNLQRKCALKVVLDHNDNSIKRFQSEAKAVAKIQHPNIIRIYDICETPCHFFVMDYVEGLPLNRYTVTLSIEEKLQLFKKICAAIQYAHDQNILHRDLKPENILVRDNGEPVIVDFGLAKNIKEEDNLTKTGEIFGSLKYMAPEIARAKKGTEQVDVYALGVILYEMLTGRVPFDGENRIELLYQLMTSEPIHPSRLNTSIPKEGPLETICMKALEKQPEKRISSVEFLHEEIQLYLNGDLIRLKPPTKWRKSIKFVKEHYVAISLTSCIMFCISFSYFWSLEKEKKLRQSQEISSSEEIFYANNELRKRSKDTMNKYFSSRRQDQFFHLSVLKKYEDLEKKIKTEGKLHSEYEKNRFAYAQI